MYFNRFLRIYGDRGQEGPFKSVIELECHHDKLKSV